MSNYASYIGGLSSKGYKVKINKNKTLSMATSFSKVMVASIVMLADPLELHYNNVIMMMNKNDTEGYFNKNSKQKY